MQTCPSCGQANPDGFRLCGMCGASLTAAPVSARAERKVVTVLFCDLAGFTSRAERLDPEDVQALLAPYHAHVRSELERHGGTVEKFIGDAVMALFGAPTAHEDDPERAVRAAIAIRDHAVESGLELRIGITTGEALISLEARPAEGQGMASGDVVNTAARLQTAAPVNGILVDEVTQRATRGTIVYSEAPAIDAKGKAAPVTAWQAIEARSRFGVDVDHHARTDLVGREREVHALRDALQRTMTERTSHLVTVVGVPGIGKSRLLYELRRIADEDPELITWRQGRCLAYGDGIAYWALGEMIKAQAGIKDRDTEAETAGKLRAAIDDAVDEPADRTWIESHLRPLVGLEATASLGDDRRGEAFAAWRRYVEALAEQRPLVLVFEDLHWADAGLLDFVDQLVDWLTDVPLLVVGTARPELLERRPGWAGGKLNATTLGLSPLSPEDTAGLIGQVLQRPVLPAEVQQALLERAAGNPFYAEQFAELYLERGSTSELPMPETIHGIIAARLDGLSTQEKSILQDASVVGKVFWPAALEREAKPIEPVLHGLARKGFLARQRRSSVDGEGEWAFAHMLLRDVAYEQIPRAERSEKHRRTAEWIDGLGRPEDHAELLAHHWSTALELGRAAGIATDALERPTRLALRAAGDRAYAVNAYPEAAAYYGDALELWPSADPALPGILFRHAEALFVADDPRAEPALGSARDALIGAGLRESAALAELSLSRIAWHGGRRAQADAHEAAAQALVEGTTSPAAARVLAFIARTRTISGDHAGGLALARDALALAERQGNDELRAHALSTIAIGKRPLNDPTARQDVEQALEIAVAIRSPQAGSIANNLAVDAWYEMDYRGYARHMREALAISEQVGDGTGVRWVMGQLVTVAYSDGDWDEALGRADRFIAECEAGSSHYLQADAHTTRARIRLGRGDTAGALADHRHALELAHAAADPQALLPNLGAAVRTLETVGLGDEAEALSSEIVAAAQEHPREAGYALALDFLVTRNAAPYEATLRRVIAAGPDLPWKAMAQTCLDRDFVHVADLWAEAGAPTWEAKVRMRAAEELIAAGRRHDGEIELAKALAFYREVGATFWIERGEALLARSA